MGLNVLLCRGLETLQCTRNSYRRSTGSGSTERLHLSMSLVRAYSCVRNYYGTGSGGYRSLVSLNAWLMAITREEVRHIAKLARLEFTEAEEETLAQDMSRILDYMDMLNELDTSEVEPMTHVLDLAHVVRTDSVEKRISKEDAVKNAPDTDGEYFRVPKVIG